MDETEKTPLTGKTVRRYKSIAAVGKAKNKKGLGRSRTLFSNKLVYHKPKSFLSDDSSSVRSVPIHRERLNEIQYEATKATASKVIQKWKEMGNNPTLRQQLAFYIDTSRIGRFWDLFDFTINLFFVCIYMWNTQYVKDDGTPQAVPFQYHMTEQFLGALLLAQWLPRIYIELDMIEFLGKPFSLLTIISTLPPLIVPFVDFIFEDVSWEASYMSGGYFVYLYPLRFMRLHYSTHKLLVPVKNPLFKLSYLMKKTLQLCSTILFMILFVTALIHIVIVKDKTIPKNFNDFTFPNVFFFTAMSSTAGFNSQNVPDTFFTRLVVLYIMVAGALFLPGKISELLAIISKLSVYDNAYEAEKNEQHILVVGKFDFNSIFEFLREFFCEDHGLQAMNSTVVILNPDEPSDELVNVLNDPAYLNRVQYVKGSPTSYHSLMKVQAPQAKACFVLTNKFANADDRESDATAVMLSLAIKRFNKNLKLYAQVSLPENKPHFNQLARQVICIQELRLGMTAQNLINPGFSTLIYLLTTSITDSTCAELSISLKIKPGLSWLNEYIQGAAQEIYSINFASCFIGMDFISVSEMLYRYFGVTLFAINVVASSPNQKPAKSSKRNIYLNPHGYKIIGTETGFIISSSNYDANRISKLGEEGNTFDEHSCLYSEDAPTFVEGNSGLEVLGENSAEAAEQTEEINEANLTAVASTENVIPFNLERTETKESLTGESIDKVKKNLVLQSDGEESDDSPSISPSKLEEVDPVYNLGSEFDAELEDQPGLSVQERNIAQVVSEMMKENSYFNDNGEVNRLSGHVVVCDISENFPKSMESFVAALRAPHLDKMLPVVILSTSIPSQRQRYVLEQLGGVYFIQGSALNRKDLFSAGVSRALKGVVLCDDSVSAIDSQRTADASSLLIVLNMESMALDPDFFVVVEFIYRENMKLLGLGETIPASETYAQALLRPSFMSGHVNSPCMLEPLICQTYYNDFIIDVLDRLIFDAHLDQLRKVQEDTSPTPGFIPSEQLVHSHVFTLAIPTIFIGRPYFHLVSHLIKSKKSVPIGIYRTTIHKSRQVSYVIVNPDPSLPIIEKDLVYYLSNTKI